LHSRLPFRWHSAWGRAQRAKGRTPKIILIIEDRSVDGGERNLNIQSFEDRGKIPK
jgi:hypothetical protein